MSIKEITSIKEYLNSLPKILIYMEEYDNLEESGTWLQFPDDFKLLFELYKDNTSVILFIKNTLKKAKEEFDKGFISLIQN